MDDDHDDERDYWRAIDREERRRNAYHWCSTCHGRTGPGSPCAVDEEPEQPEDDEMGEA